MNENYGCNSCSKETFKVIPLSRVMAKLDELFSRNDLPAVGRTLDYWESEARALKDERGLLEILNEKIGYFRRTGEKDKAIEAVNSAFSLIEKHAIGDPISYGTVYLNGATTLKAFGLPEEAMPYYDKALALYKENLECDDYRLAAFYNNVSSAYKDLGDPARAEECCYKAIDILKGKKEFRGEIAVSLINVAHIYYDEDPLDDKVYTLMDKAWELLSSEDNVHDGDFAFVCAKCYPAFGFFGYFEREAELKALSERIYEGN